MEGFHHQRHVLALMLFLAIFVAYALRMLLSISITVMVKKNPEKIDPYACPDLENKNSTDNKTVGGYDFDWSESTQGFILASFYWGYFPMHIPGGILAQKYGGKHTLGVGILLTAIFTLLSPLAAYQGPFIFMCIRILEGLGEATTFPGINQLLAQWIPLSERGRVGSFVFAGTMGGTIFSSTVSGFILSWTNNYWPAVFYFFGGLSIVWYLIYNVICYNDPASHPWISKKEKDYLEKEIGGLSRRKDLPPTPWLAIAKAPPVIALVVAELGHDWALFTMNTDLPKYMHSVLKFNVKSNGMVSALPFLAMWLTALAAGWLSDIMVKNAWFSLTTNRKIFTAMASMGPAIGLLAASYAGCNRVMTAFWFTLGMGFMGFYYPSIRVNTLDLAPNYAGSLMAIVNGTGAISGILSPIIIGQLVPNATLLEWRLVFWISFIILSVTNLVYMFFGSGAIQPWNEPGTGTPEESPPPPNIPKEEPSGPSVAQNIPNTELE